MLPHGRVGIVAGMRGDDESAGWAEDGKEGVDDGFGASADEA
jgi:hypothetical protein